MNRRYMIGIPCFQRRLLFCFFLLSLVIITKSIRTYNFLLCTVGANGIYITKETYLSLCIVSRVVSLHKRLLESQHCASAVLK